MHASYLYNLEIMKRLTNNTGRTCVHACVNTGLKCPNWFMHDSLLCVCACVRVCVCTLEYFKKTRSGV